MKSDSQKKSGAWQENPFKFVEYIQLFRMRSVAILLVLTISLSILPLGCVPGKSGSDSSKGGASITFAGSTSVQPFAEMLAEEYAAKYPDRPSINVQGGGSSAGARAALTGAAQVGMMSRELDPSEKELSAIVIAHDAIAVVVHPSNPVTNLTKDQVRKIFSGAISDWSQVGGKPGKIHVVSREEGSGTRGSFDEMVLGGEDVDPRAIVQDSNGAVRETVADDPNAIGYISLGIVDQRVKAVSIDGVQPTVDNCKSGKYAVVRPFLFVYKGELSQGAKDFIDFVLSDEGQKLLANEGLVTVK